MHALRSLIFSALTLMFCAGSSAAKESIGIAASQPAAGRFVPIPGGYMVPYRQQIPGTKVSFEMVPVPGGKLRLTSGDGEQVVVPLQPFWMGRYEVTWGEFDPFYDVRTAFVHFDRMKVRQVTEENLLDAVTAPSVLYDVRTRYPDTNDKRLRAKYPAVSMTQLTAKQYTKWLSKLTTDFYRLPSEAEWEHACRAGSSHGFAFGDDLKLLDDYGWFTDNAEDSPQPVGQKKPNAWGLFDMHGNACEWVLDQFHASYAPLTKAVASELANHEPIVTWPTQPHPRTVRGGSWASAAMDCRCGSRRGSSEAWQDDDPSLPQSPFWLACANQAEFGFRVVRQLHAPPTTMQTKYWDADCEPLREAVQEYSTNGYTRRGIVDPRLPAAMQQLQR